MLYRASSYIIKLTRPSFSTNGYTKQNKKRKHHTRDHTLQADIDFLNNARSCNTWAENITNVLAWLPHTNLWETLQMCPSLNQKSGF